MRSRPEALFHRKWTRTVVQQALARLEGAPGRLEAFRLRIDGLSLREVAAKTGLTEEGAKSAVRRMRERFREILAEQILPELASRQHLEEELADCLSEIPCPAAPARVVQGVEESHGKREAARPSRR